MVSKRATKLTLVFLSGILISGCNLTKMVPDGKHLLKTNKVKGVHYSATKGEILEQVKLKPNRRIFFIKTHLIAHKIGTTVGLDKIGEKPVLVDTALVIASANNIQRYLFKKGYFNNEVSYTIKQGKLAKAFNQRKLKVIYEVDEKTPYRIDSIHYVSENAEIKKLMIKASEKSLIKSGNNVDYDVISSERSRLNTYFKNQGYYFFNPSYIDFVVDSANGNYTADIDVRILDPQYGTHQKQFIHSVEVNIRTSQTSSDSSVNERTGIVFFFNGLEIDEKVLTRNILLKPGQQFSQQRLQNTYGRLVSLDLFESLNIQADVHNGDSSRLDIKIMLDPAPKYELTWQPQIVTTEQRFNQSQSSRNYGLANEISLKNKNAFKNGEEFSINLRTALETQITRDTNKIFSTFIQEINTELKIPHLLFLRKWNDAAQLKSANTQFNASYLYEDNPFYRRNLFPLSYTYRFDLDQSQLFMTPLLVSLNKASYKPNLIDQGSASYIQTLNRLFTNNLITSWKIGGVYNNSNLSPKSFIVINSNLLEVAGMFLPQFTDYGQKLGVNHSTFIRSDVDFRYHLSLNENHSFVARAFTGAGVPVGDRSVLPYERRFFAGGTNYMRGWRIRTVGPGSFTADNNLQFTRTGELSMIGNLEYRFNIFRGYVDLNGAVFLDAGNVWNLKADTLFPGGEFNSDRFYTEFAFNTGLGIRLDFDFLLLRFDWGVPIWDPNFALEDRLVIENAFKHKWLLRRPVWNVAVGYPF